MPRIKCEKQLEDGWTRWIVPNMELYRLACCDCGLSHDLEMRVLEVTKTMKNGTRYVIPAKRGKYIVEFRARRNNRSTAQIRRKHG